MRDKAFNIAKNPKYYGYQRGLAFMVYKFFGAVALTKKANIDKYGYSGYGIGFDRRSSFSFPGGVY